MARLATTLAANVPAHTTVSDDAHDAALVQRIARGERGALAELYTRYQRPLFQYLLGLARDRGTAEEILQDALVAVWRSAATFGGRSSVKTWLIGIARRQAHNTLRRAVFPVTELVELEQYPTGEANPEQAALQQADREALAAAFGRLSPLHREALLLVFQHGLSYQEIAEVLDIPVGTVRSRLSNAKQALKALLSRQQPELH